MTTRDIRTSTQDAVCDVCGRTLLRGEDADVYLDNAVRRSVCELCKDRAVHEGWVREGTVTGYDDSHSQPDRRRSLLGRLLGRRERPGAGATKLTLRDELDGHAWSESAPVPPAPEAASDAAAAPVARARDDADSGRPPAARNSSGRETLRRNSGGSANRATGDPAPPSPREPRHIRAVPTSLDQKIASATQLFNESEHPRTVAGVARSLGAPAVCVMPSVTRPSLVTLVVAWELCWYRYEVDLSDEVRSVRLASRGYELSELTPEELRRNAVADEHGALAPSD